MYRKKSTLSVDNASVCSNAFESFGDRKGFLVKVFTLLFVFALVTAGIVAFMYFDEELQWILIDHLLGIFVIAVASYLLMSLSVICFPLIRKIFPINFFFLLVQAFSVAVMFGVLTIKINTSLFWISFLLTACVLMVLMILSAVCPTDWAKTQMFLTVLLAFLLVGLVVLALTAGFFKKYIYYIVSGLILTFFAILYIGYTSQLILNGRHDELTPDDVVLGVSTYYMEFILLIMYIIRMLGELSNC